MDRDPLAALERLLQDVADGVMEERRFDGAGAAGQTLYRPLPPGRRGRREVYAVLPGTRFFCACHIAPAPPPPSGPPAAAVVACCRSGLLCWQGERGAAAQIGPGEAALWFPEDLLKGTATFPLGYYAGYTLAVEGETLAAHLPPALAAAGWRADCLMRTPADGPVLLGGGGLGEILAPLEHVPPSQRFAHSILKAQELLLRLSALPPEGRPPIRSRHVRQVQELHALLTGDLTRRYTIEELSRRALINTTSLKSAFKALYGQPIGAYMKAYRIRRAQELLCAGEASIAEIAAEVGYETQGKFARAFQDVTGMLPSVYRRLHRR